MTKRKQTPVEDWPTPEPWPVVTFELTPEELERIEQEWNDVPTWDAEPLGFTPDDAARIEQEWNAELPEWPAEPLPEWDVPEW